MLGSARLAFWHLPARRYFLELYLLENLLFAQHLSAVSPVTRPLAAHGDSLRLSVAMAHLFAELEARVPRLEWLEYATRQEACKTARARHDAHAALHEVTVATETALVQAERHYRLYRQCHAQLRDMQLRAQNLNLGFRRAGAFAPILAPDNRVQPTPPGLLPALPPVHCEARLLAEAGLF